MQGYLNKGKEILKILVNNGFEAYYYGETVRNSILGLDCDTVYIITAANKTELQGLFSRENFTILQNGFAQLIVDDYRFLIKSFEEIERQGKASQTKNAPSGLVENLGKQDFTINALAMSSSGKITDAYDGYKDIKKKTIKTVGSSKQRFYDDPVMILRAFTIVSNLNFKFFTTTSSGIKKRIKNLSQLDARTIGEEMKQILAGRYAKKALALMNNLGIENGIPLFKKSLKLYTGAKNYDYEEFIACSMVASGAVDDEFLKTLDPDRQEYVYNVVNNALANPKSKFDKLTLFTYGQSICLASYKINKILGLTSGSLEKKITKEIDKLPIKKKCDLKFKGEDIMRITDLEDADTIGELFEDLVFQVVTGVLPNEYQALEDYTCKELASRGIPYDTSRKEIRIRQSIKNDELKAQVQKQESKTQPSSSYQTVKNELDDYQQFIKNYNSADPEDSVLKEKSYWTEGITNSHEDKYLLDRFSMNKYNDNKFNDKTELPEIKNRYNTASLVGGQFSENTDSVDNGTNQEPHFETDYEKYLYEVKKTKMTVNEEVDDIDYSHYKDPQKPNFENVNDVIYGSQPNPNKGKMREVDPFEDEVDEVGDDYYASSSYKIDNTEHGNVEVSYEHHVIDEATNQRLRELEEKVYEQDRLLKEKNLELDKQKLNNATSKITYKMMNGIRQDDLPSFVNKDDFENSLKEFIQNYMNSKTPK